MAINFHQMAPAIHVKQHLTPQQEDVEQMKVILKQAEAQGKLSKEVLRMKPEDFVLDDSPMSPAEREWHQGEVDRKKYDMQHEQGEIKKQGDILTAAFNGLGPESKQEVMENLDSIVYEPVEVTK
jgi:hypothetical protein